MKLVTWNVNSLKVRMPRVLEFLEQHRPAVLCLQETKTEVADFPHLELQAAGYQGIEHSGGRWAGVAILAPTGSDIEDVRATRWPSGRLGWTCSRAARWASGSTTRCSARGWPTA